MIRKKYYCYVDETGQGPEGKTKTLLLFGWLIVCVVLFAMLKRVIAKAIGVLLI